MEWLAKESKTNAAICLCLITGFSSYEVHFIFRFQAYWEWSLLGWLLTSIQWIYSLPLWEKNKKYLDWCSKIQVWFGLFWSWNDRNLNQEILRIRIARAKNPPWHNYPFMAQNSFFFYPVWANHLQSLSVFFI